MRCRKIRLWIIWWEWRLLSSNGENYQTSYQMLRLSESKDEDEEGEEEEKEDEEEEDQEEEGGDEDNKQEGEDDGDSIFNWGFSDVDV